MVDILVKVVIVVGILLAFAGVIAITVRLVTGERPSGGQVFNLFAAITGVTAVAKWVSSAAFESPVSGLVSLALCFIGFTVAFRTITPMSLGRAFAAALVYVSVGIVAAICLYAFVGDAESEGESQPAESSVITGP